MNDMPVVFVGHGSPMNALGDNQYTAVWSQMAKSFPRPKAILSISAHWYTSDTLINNQNRPEQIYDFYGFPRELYEIVYHPNGASGIADNIAETLGYATTERHGIDHGTWCPLRFFYPDADIPVIPFSINMNLSLKASFDLGAKLSYLRQQEVLIFGSGNIVHNLRVVDFSMPDGYEWADSFDEYIFDAVIKKDTGRIINIEEAGESASKAVPTPDHYLPFLYAAGAAGNGTPEVYNKARELGSISMTSYIWR